MGIVNWDRAIPLLILIAVGIGVSFFAKWLATEVSIWIPFILGTVVIGIVAVVEWRAKARNRESPSSRRDW